MYPKYIIAGDRSTGRGCLRMGMVINHKDLIVEYEKVWGGGWWDRDDRKKTITLYGSSCDFGSADFRHLKIIEREWRDYTFIYTPMTSLPGNVVDLSDVEWI